MAHRLNFVSIIILVFLLNACKQEEGWVNLLDEDLSNWDRYLSFKHQVGYDGNVPMDQNGNEILPIGLNPSGYGVFTSKIENGEHILKVSGEVYGGISTKKDYRNYHLRLQFKWGDKKYVPRMDLLKDSGILYHSIGEHGKEHWRSWMLSQEFQIMEGHLGDYWNQATSAIDIRAYQPEYIMNPVADVSQPFLPIGEGEDINGYCMRSANYEKPTGEWNTLELICFEGKSIHIVNGRVVMVLRNSRYIDGGVEKPLVEGKIQLQSEAAEVFYKQIEIKELEALPQAYLSLF